MSDQDKRAQREPGGDQQMERSAAPLQSPEGEHKKVTTLYALDMGIEALVTRRRQLVQYKHLVEQGFEWAKPHYERWLMFDEAIRALRDLRAELYPDAGASWADPDHRYQAEE